MDFEPAGRYGDSLVACYGQQGYPGFNEDGLYLFRACLLSCSSAAAILGAGRFLRHLSQLGGPPHPSDQLPRKSRLGMQPECELKRLEELIKKLSNRSASASMASSFEQEYYS